MNPETFYGILISVALSALILPLLLGYGMVLFYYYPIIRPSMQPMHARYCGSRYWFRFSAMLVLFAGLIAGTWILCDPEAFWGLLLGSSLILVTAILLHVPERYGARFAALIVQLEERDSDLFMKDDETTVFDVTH
ncbi:MAG: hypothetical protein FWE69_00335 [Clostridiales bacterium]|nr:hypothetical protein [Clostridiales bacterium]